MEKKQDFFSGVEQSPESETNVESDKIELYKEIFCGEPDAIFVLSGEITKKPGDTLRPYRSTSFATSDSFGMLGGKARVVAAAEVGKYLPNVKIVTTSRSMDPERSEEPTHAQVMAIELKHYGIPQDQIMLEEESTTTLTEIVEMIKLSRRNDWKHVGIISNAYHLPRVQAIYEHIQDFTNDDEVLEEALQFFRQNNLTISYVPAEEILPHRSSHFVKLIHQAQQSEEYLRRIESERIGLQKVKEKTYVKDQHTPEDKEPK